MLYQSTGEYAKAEPFALQARDLHKKLLGENHPHYAQSVNNLAALYQLMGEYAKAEPLFLQARDLRKKLLGENHPYYAGSLNNLAVLYQSMGEYAKAELLFLQARDLRKKLSGENHPDYPGSLNNLAALYQSMGEYAKAEPLLKECTRASICSRSCWARATRTMPTASATSPRCMSRWGSTLRPSRSLPVHNTHRTKLSQIRESFNGLI